MEKEKDAYGIMSLYLLATNRDPDLPFSTISRQYCRGFIRILLRQRDFAARNHEGLA